MSFYIIFWTDSEKFSLLRIYLMLNLMVLGLIWGHHRLTLEDQVAPSPELTKYLYRKNPIAIESEVERI